MNLSATDLRAGTIFSENGKVYMVQEYHHHKMGRGKATIRVKVRDIMSGGTREITFNNNAVVEEVDAIKKNFEFVYLDEKKREIVLSDPSNKSRLSVPIEVLGIEGTQYLSEGSIVQVLMEEDTKKILTIELPITVELEVSETGSTDKGDTAGSARKPATLKSGLVIQVPMFIKIGDRVKVNTQSGEYVERIA